MEAMPCRDRRVVGPAGAEAGMPASGEGGPRQLRFADPGPGSGDSLSPDSSSSSADGSRCCCAGGNGCCAGDGGAEAATTTATATRHDWPGSAAAQLKLLPMNDQIRELQTIIRDKTASRGDFVFSADRLIRLVVEEGLNRLPYTECTVTTPTDVTGFFPQISDLESEYTQLIIQQHQLRYKYEGVKFEKGNCGVSIMRSGEAMEQGLRDCCRSIRIGKILIQSDEETQRAKVYYAKFPPDIYRRKVLLMYPILSTGNTVIEAVKVLIEHGVQPNVIILLSLFSTPHGAKSIIQEFPDITILTTEVHPVAPTHFGQKYFGTD
ncbi:uracil phosphoribosyltransferase homolog isoform X1 [Ahaetulla prasina]|uniref:uracil phosphoribosyltransferase homolog isoform X1 n=1 Tax=Ahaetulla prasina TaxID=499056 RepID=UPI002649F025|nr:uracil phosphoribosyltransferase homolog isoform X1 [Ahaetulla prasina]XP_058052845.1 uracil phosphoribosyltransferase homolog isoform X1 [Ahaetulla prasina]